MIKFDCTACRKSIETEDFFSGRKAACPHCGAQVQVPAAPTPTAPPPPTTAPAPSGDVPSSPGTPTGAEGVSGLEGEVRCTKCGALRKGDGKACGFCGTLFPAVPRAASPAVPGSWKSRLKAAAALLWSLAMAGGILAAFLPGATSVADPEEQSLGCLESLKAALGRCLASDAPLPQNTGSAFWIEVAGREFEQAALTSTAAQAAGFQGAAGFRGPVQPYERCAEAAAVACERPGALPGRLTVLYKDGRIAVVAENTPEYTRALEETRE